MDGNTEGFFTVDRPPYLVILILQQKYYEVSTTPVMPGAAYSVGGTEAESTEGFNSEIMCAIAL